MVRNISMMERRYCSTGSFMFTMNGGRLKNLAIRTKGDWEMIQIILGDKNKPERITFGYHHGGKTFGWDDKDEENKEEVKKVRMATIP